MGTIFHLTARVRCPFPVSIASLEEHLESVVIVPTSLEKATATGGGGEGEGEGSGW